MKYTLRIVIEALKNNKVFVLYLVGDQRPASEDLDYWTTFLNQDTPVITGIEKLVKRGYFKVTFREISESPVNTKPNEITEKYIRKVEEMINKRPELWLWSHKRWKYDPKKYKPKPTE